VFVGLRGLKDFYPAYLADNVARVASVSARAVEVAPPLGRDGDVSSVGFARRFEQAEFRDAVVRELEGRLEAGERVGFPAVLGLGRAREVWRDLEGRLERPVFEVPTLPPSAQGVRLYEAMTAALRQAGGRVVVGSAIVGAENGGGRLEAVVAQTAGRPLAYRARSFVLASGGFASGGLELDSFGKVRETVLDLPVSGVPGPEQRRFEPGYFDGHALARAGVAVDEQLRPVDGGGAPVYENLHAAGATLAGAVAWREGSGNGVSLTTGYAAATAIVERNS
jgi:glycerol-3-phosphate dehydrogenase subunit B